MDKIEVLRSSIKDEIAFLRQSIIETKYGGWSTHLVEPMNNRINTLVAVLADLGLL